MSRSAYLQELRKEIADEPEELHLGGLVNNKSKFMTEQEELEEME
jgi:hypothetical protein